MSKKKKEDEFFYMYIEFPGESSKDRAVIRNDEIVGIVEGKSISYYKHLDEVKVKYLNENKVIEHHNAIVLLTDTNRPRLTDQMKTDLTYSDLQTGQIASPTRKRAIQPPARRAEDEDDDEDDVPLKELRKNANAKKVKKKNDMETENRSLHFLEIAKNSLTTSITDSSFEGDDESQKLQESNSTCNLSKLFDFQDNRLSAARLSKNVKTDEELQNLKTMLEAATYENKQLQSKVDLTNSLLALAMEEKIDLEKVQVSLKAQIVGLEDSIKDLETKDLEKSTVDDPVRQGTFPIVEFCLSCTSKTTKLKMLSKLAHNFLRIIGQTEPLQQLQLDDQKKVDKQRPNSNSIDEAVDGDLEIHEDNRPPSEDDSHDSSGELIIAECGPEPEMVSNARAARPPTAPVPQQQPVEGDNKRNKSKAYRCLANPAFTFTMEEFTEKVKYYNDNPDEQLKYKRHTPVGGCIVFNSGQGGLMINQEAFQRCEAEKIKAKPVKSKTELIKTLFLAMVNPEAMYFVSWLGKTRGSNSMVLAELNATLKDELKTWAGKDDWNKKLEYPIKKFFTEVRQKILIKDLPDNID